MGELERRHCGSLLLHLPLEIFLCFLTLVIFMSLILPLFSILFLGCYIWRLLLIFHVRLISRRYERVMDGQNPVVAIDDLHGKPLCTIVGMGAFDGRLDFQSAMTFVSNIVNDKNTVTQKFLNPELRQHYEEWMGFIWWKWEVDFSLQQHVKLWDSSQLPNGIAEEETVVKIISYLEGVPFPKEKSPWEVIVVRNVNLKGVIDPAYPKTAIIFRFHHGLADGIALMQLFMKFVFKDAYEKVAQPIYAPQNPYQRYLHKVIATLQLPYQFFKQGIAAYDVNEWHLPEYKLRRDVTKGMTKRISINTIKKIKKNHDVGFTAVLISAVAGSLHHIMTLNGVSIPKKMHAILPLPWPSHPAKLCNHWSYGFMTLPVGTDNRKKRLKKCHKYINQLKKSPSPAVNFAILTAFNLLPTWLIRKTTLTNYFPTVILSNFPGPPPGTTGFGGWALVDCCFTGGPLRGNIGISITILSYDGFLRIVVGVDKAIFPKDEMTKGLVDAIETEFNQLEQQSSEDSVVV